MFPQSVTIASRRYVAEQPRTLPADMHFVRVLHERELSRRTNPQRRPEVRPLFTNHYVPFGRSWQMLAWDLNGRDGFTANNMTAIYHYQLWIANQTGFGNASDPRRNYFDGTGMTGEELKVEALTCGGNVLRVTGETLAKVGAQMVPAWIIETLDWRTVPTLDYLRARPWLVTWAVNLAGPDGITPQHFTMGQGGVRHPLVADPARFTVCIEKWRTVEWTDGEPPEVLRLYV